jgi:uncharacterized protein YbcI
MSKRTKKSLEAEIADAVAQAHRQQQGRGPQDVHVDIINDVILIRQRGVLNPMETRLAATREGQRLIRSAHKELTEIARADRDAIIADIVGCKIVRSYGDIDISAAEEICVFVLDADLEKRLLRQDLDALSGIAPDAG